MHEPTVRQGQRYTAVDAGLAANWLGSTFGHLKGSELAGKLFLKKSLGRSVLAISLVVLPPKNPNPVLA